MTVDGGDADGFGGGPGPLPGLTGCEWPIDDGCLGSSWDTLPSEVQDRSVALAANTLRRLTGYRVGGCPIIVRPCKAGCASGMAPYHSPYGSSFYPHNLNGTWINSCGCSTECSCGSICEVALPGPVGAVYEVKVDGVTVPPTDYFVTKSRLVWSGEGDCPWPTCQDLSKPDTEPGTFSVRYLNSYPVDGLGAYAAGTLAAEYALACQGQNCRLPAGVTAIARAGVSYEVMSGAFPDGFTGIREVDAYISLWNPGGLRQQSKVYSPDISSPRHQAI